MPVQDRADKPRNHMQRRLLSLRTDSKPRDSYAKGYRKANDILSPTCELLAKPKPNFSIWQPIEAIFSFGVITITGSFSLYQNQA